MADVQIAVIDQQNTQIALAAPSETEVTVAVPGVQGPVGEGVPSGGTANQVLFKQSGTDYDTAWSEVTSAMIGDLEIVNADVAAAAAIDGTKINPNFGSQNVVTTGTATAAALIPSGSSVPTNGVYLPSANNVAISTNGTGRLFVDASGNVGVGTSLTTAYFTNYTPFKLSGSAGGSLGIERAGELRLLLTADNSFSYVSSFGNGGIVFSAQAGAFSGSTGTEHMRLDSSGRLGLGTSSPAVNLHVNSSGNTIAEISSSFSNSTTTGLLIDTTGDSSVGSVAFYKAGVQRGAVGYYHNANGASERLGLNVAGGTDKFSLTGAGNVGIGTTNPSAAVEINAAAATSPFIAKINNAEAARITADGKLGLGTSSPQKTLHVAAGSSGFTGSYNSRTAAIVESSNSFGTGLSIMSPSTGQSNLGFGDESNEYAGLFAYDHTSDSIRFFQAGQERVRIDSSGRLGLGTSSPQNLLHVHNPSAADANLKLSNNTTGSGQYDGFTFECSSTGLAKVTQWEQHPIYFYTNNGSAVGVRLAITAAGRVGIGTTSPSDQLHVYTNQADNVIAKLENAHGSNGNLLQFVHGSGGANVAYLGHGGDTTGNLLIFNAANTATTFSTNNTERARITSDGKLGVGTSAPQNTIHAHTASNTVNVIQLTNSATGAGPGDGMHIIVDTSEMQIRNRENGDLNFWTNNTKAVTIDPSQRVGIGTTTVGAPLHVKATVSTTNIFENTGSTESYLYLKNSTSGGYIGSIGNDITFKPSNGVFEAARIDSSGRLLVGTSSASTGTIAQYSKLQILGNTSSSASGAQLNLGRNETSVNVANNELLGGIHFTDNQAGEYAFIEGRADGTPGVGDYPGRLVFSTCASGSSSPTERMRITADGNISFGSSGYNLGFSNTVSINPSDGLIGFGMDGREEYMTGAAGCYIYSGSGSSGTTLAGELILQSRSNQLRPITFVTGSTPTKRMEITGAGYVRLASGTGGIQFNGDTAAANALDDYEEGTWTPALNWTGVTYTVQSGYYTKIGNTVHVHATITWTANDVASATVISGLPFATSNATDIGTIKIVDVAVPATLSYNSVEAFASSLYVRYVNTSGASINYPVAANDAGTINVNCVYKVA
jgi:hypothetical protein